MKKLLNSKSELHCSRLDLGVRFTCSSNSWQRFRSFVNRLSTISLENWSSARNLFVLALIHVVSERILFRRDLPESSLRWEMSDHPFSKLAHPIPIERHDPSAALFAGIVFLCPLQHPERRRQFESTEKDHQRSDIGNFAHRRKQCGQFSRKDELEITGTSTRLCMIGNQTSQRQSAVVQLLLRVNSIGVKAFLFSKLSILMELHSNRFECLGECSVTTRR